jgi:glycosyltransferase involved in cell wall biosynthesis
MNKSVPKGVRSLLRVGIFTDSYRPYTSGVVRSIDTFRTELEPKDVLFYIFAPRYPGCAPEERVYRFISVPAPTNPGFRLAVPLSLRIGATLKRLKLDLIHAHSPFLMGGLGARWAKHLGIPLVFTYHTLYEEYVHYFPLLNGPARSATRRRTIGFCNRSDLVIAPTRVIETHLKDSGVSTHVKVLPTGVKLSVFRGGDREGFRKRYGISAREPVLVYVGRLGKEKNIEFLLRALRFVNERVPGVRLVLVGGGPQRAELMEKARENRVERQVVFTGPIPPDKVKDSYAAGDIFVMASLTETQGLVIGEAKAAGLPAVAVSAQGVSEMVNEGVDGFLTPLDAEVFASRICRLVEDPGLRQTFQSNALKKAEELDASRVAENLLVLYRTLLAGTGKSF